MPFPNYQIKRGAVEIPAGSISYFRAGEGHPVVLLHSLALSADMWIPVLGDFLTAGEVIAIDLRGHGRSTYDGKDFTVEELAVDVRIVLDALNLKKVNMLGLSMGGCVAINFAAANPDYVERLALCDTTSWYGPDAPKSWQARANTAMTRPRVMQIPFQVDRWFGERFRRINPRMVSHVVKIFMATRPEVHAKSCLALGAFDNSGQLHNIIAPTLVITGEDDDATPPDMGQRLGSEIPNGRFELAKGLRHFALFESSFVRSAVVQHFSGVEVDGEMLSSLESCCPATVIATVAASEEEKKR